MEVFIDFIVSCNLCKIWTFTQNEFLELCKALFLTQQQFHRTNTFWIDGQIASLANCLVVLFFLLHVGRPPFTCWWSNKPFSLWCPSRTLSTPYKPPLLLFSGPNLSCLPYLVGLPVPLNLAIFTFSCVGHSVVSDCDPMDYVACKTPLSIFLVDVFSVKGLRHRLCYSLFFILVAWGLLEKKSLSFLSQTHIHTHTYIYITWVCKRKFLVLSFLSL